MVADVDTPTASRREKIDALISVLKYDPRLTVLIVGVGIVAAVLEGVGLSFLLPIIELVQSGGQPGQSGNLGAFATVYQTVNVPLTLGTAVIGVAVVMTIRFAASFLVAWLREILRMSYIRDLQTEAFANAFEAEIAYVDDVGSDDTLNAIITQTFHAGQVIRRLVLFLEQSFLGAVYGLIAFVISPRLTVLTVAVLGSVTLLLRVVIEPDGDIGDRVADANERRQQTAQAGIQGMRESRIFGLVDELYGDFVDSVEQYTSARIKLRRNQAAINNFYQLTVAVSVFALIYVSLTYVDLTLSSLGLFLFAMFRLGPKASRANELFYRIGHDLPHLVRTRQFTRDLAQNAEPDTAERAVPDRVESITATDVTFSYDGETDVLKEVDFAVERGEFVAFVGQSGAGKSTVVSLLSRMYEPTGGEIRANGVPIGEMDISAWRDRIAVVSQDPYIFDDTLRYNLTIADRDATDAEIDRACELARVDEFLEDLPNGYDTSVGDDGVRLSGGQKQRVAIARALIDDVDVLLLDEATSDLDTNLEREVQRGFETMDREYIVVTVAHRLSTVQNADRIYTLDDGVVTEVGSHDELVENDGEYADLYAVQGRR
ncbi:ABC transporter ATP-binding protein [Halostagnicola kamekurae]|uniref:ATP-binding cassette, subfamily B, MsbA n=1 Tax=Halostagnicola kamekurae TaxID=619731 RepID=A0A1I6PLY3_9EURY|nr:ABC transporter ATP-binding protein [Halostagnicola kamekurae]SFS41223.1 ATP-binding cassette, subfamily B, MsbA [Halostagnicola kamekurae]